MDIAKHVGMRIRTFRKQKRMTLKQLADALNKSESTLSKYETGDISIDITTLYEIALYLGVSINQIMDYQEDNHNTVTKKNVGNFFERQDKFYMYQYFGPTKTIWECVLEIIRKDNEDDSAILYYGIPDEVNFTNSEYIYAGNIYYYDSVVYMFFYNQYNFSDKVFIYAKSPFTSKHTTVGLVTGLSSSMRNPYAFKVLFSEIREKQDAELKDSLLITKKEVISEIRRTNSLVIF